MAEHTTTLGLWGPDVVRFAYKGGRVVSAIRYSYARHREEVVTDRDEIARLLSLARGESKRYRNATRYNEYTDQHGRPNRVQILGQQILMDRGQDLQ